MVKLIVPPNVIGTGKADTVLGEEKANTLATGIQVLNEGIINTYSGNDTITGTGALTSTNGIATGISNDGIIETGNGDDKIKGIASSAKVSLERSTDAIGITNSGIISSGNGDDSIVGIGTGGYVDFGISNGDNGVINTGDGDDKIIGTGTCEIKGGNVGVGIGLSAGGLIDLGKGDDSIIGTGIGNNNGNSGRGIEIFESAIKGGDGHDSIIGTTTASQAVGITNIGGNISGGNGNDLIKGTGIDVGEVIGYGIDNANLFGDKDNDTINATIDGGDGDDSIIGIGISNGLGIGIILSGQIDGGKGNDKIFGYGTNVGIQGGSIDGGIGNDYFKSRKVDGLDADDNPIESANQSGSISDILIAGGKGNDIFDVGYGNATLDGGEGFDTLILLGSSNNYSIQNSNGSSTFVRDGYTLTALNIENIVFEPEPLGTKVV
ncbi:MAG: hypothetical protein ACYTXE_36235 [Nostoc sp.]